MNIAKQFSLLIPTKDRRLDILYTLEKSTAILNDSRVECIVIDNGTDGASDAIKLKYPEIRCINEPNNLGIFHLRNRLISEATGEYLLFIDDDVNFLENNVLDTIIHNFSAFPSVGIVAFRIFWGIDPPISNLSRDSVELVKSFGAGACCIRKKSIKMIPNLPVWFNFYGEEDFISLNLFKKNIQVLYSPEILVHHRVDLKLRRQNVKNFQERYRKAFRAGLYNIIIFYPLFSLIYFLLYYSKHQLVKIFSKNGGMVLLIPVLLGYGDVFRNFFKLLKERSPLSKKEFKEYRAYSEAKLYWKPEEKGSI